MISYEFAKRLKDAGFPQDPTVKIDDNCTCDFHQSSESVTVPTLSELIAACGGKISMFWCEYAGVYVAIERGLGGEEWIPGYLDEDRGENSFPMVRTGKSYEEAVARLWLALNEKQ
jgi:hypothetical protein